MLAFGETLERGFKDVAGDRAKLKKGKVLGRRRSVELVAKTKDCLVLPNITTTQLTQNCEASLPSGKEAREGMNGKQERKPSQQMVKRGRLKDNSFMLEEIKSEDRHLEDFEGLFVSKLNLQKESFEDIIEERDLGDITPGRVSKEGKPRSRLSKTDSGFYEDTNEDLATSYPATPNESDGLSDASNSSGTSPDRHPTAFTSPTSYRSSRSESKRRVTLDLKAVLPQDKTVVRNTERLTRRAHMCTQSHGSLRADLVAFKSFAAQNASSANYDQSMCVKLKEVRLNSAARKGSLDSAVKQSDTSLALLKTRRRLLGERKSADPQLFRKERLSRKQCVVDMRSCNEKNRSQSSNIEQRDSFRRRSCIELLSPRSNDHWKPAKNDNEFESGRPSSGLTEEALADATRSQDDIHVNDKCQEWLNRWLASNGPPHPEETLRL